MNDETRLHSPDSQHHRKPLPEDTGRTLGPDHIDMVFERLEEARGISSLLYSAVGRGELLPEADLACMGQRRLLQEAEEHLGAFYDQVREERRRDGARQPINQNAVTAALARLKRFDEILAVHTPNDDDHRLLDEAIDLLEGRLPGADEDRAA